eukprot:5182329-Pyramimonas_sp.AAC.1
MPGFRELPSRAPRAHLGCGRAARLRQCCHSPTAPCICLDQSTARGQWPHSPRPRATRAPTRPLPCRHRRFST